MATMTLRAARRAADITQMQLAAKSGIGQPAISALERGDRCNPKLDTVRKLEAALNLPAGTLVFGRQVAA